MPKYICERCCKGFTQKSHYDAHNRRKRPCENQTSKVQKIIERKVQETISNLSIEELNEVALKIDTGEITTFIGLYKFLQKNIDADIKEWLADSWTGKDKQESLLRLFAGLGLIQKLKGYRKCRGNFNKQTIKPSTMRDIFYDEKDNLINLKDCGDSSDLTCIAKDNPKHLLLTTSKNMAKLYVGDLDLEKLIFNFEPYESQGYTRTICICVRDRTQIQVMRENMKESSHNLKDELDREDIIIIDWDDLKQAYYEFKKCFGNKSLQDIINIKKDPLCLKLHQHLGVIKTLKLKENKSKILWGHIQRSGKSYIIAGCIAFDSLGKNKCNYLILTTAPSETINQQHNVLNCAQLQDFNIIMLDGNNKKPTLSDKNIILCSKQFLQSKIDDGNEAEAEKTKSIAWLKRMRFEMRFVDESHNGGTTSLAKKTLDFYGKDVFTVQITATYSKPVNDYGIPRDSWVLWDLEDIKLAKDIKNPESMERLIQKHGEELRELLTHYSLDNIAEEYSKYPELWLLTDRIKPEISAEIIRRTKDNEYGWSVEGCFLLKQAVSQDEKTGEKKLVVKEEFQNEAKALKIWYRIFGKRDQFGIPDAEYPDDIVFMKRIEKICKNPMIDSRFNGDGGLNGEPAIIMAFLPQKNINSISQAVVKLLKRHTVIPEYDIVCINSRVSADPRQTIEDARTKAKISGKKGVLVLSGKQCSLGVSIDNCDIVLLLNDSMKFDMIYQMMFRCMTEAAGKKCGFVVDLNTRRAIETTVVKYSLLVKPGHPKNAVKYTLQERLINLNGDHWIQSFGNSPAEVMRLCDNAYDIYTANLAKALEGGLDMIQFADIPLLKNEQVFINSLFDYKAPTQQRKEAIERLLKEDNEEIKKGIEKILVENSNGNETAGKDEEIEEKKEEEKEIKKKDIKYIDVIKHLIPLICLITARDMETEFIKMANTVENNAELKDILVSQIQTWWGKDVDINTIKLLIKIYRRADNKVGEAITYIKELFVKNIANSRELSNIIDVYLKPHELEKKKNAEVSTPYILRQEMLDKMPAEFWTEIHRVLEPCAGKGGFLLDIVDWFMEGLKDLIPDEKQRYKTIVEQCLYFADINPINIFICKLLLDPYGEYNLNYYEGDSLALDIKRQWGIDGFDAVIGNPPYQKSSGNKGKGNTLWDLFVKQSLNKWLVEDGLLVFVHPQGWRQIDNKIGKLMLSKQIIYLNMNDEKRGLETFKCATTFDYYVLQNCPIYKDTKINDYKNIEIEYNLKNIRFIPNHSIDKIYRYIDTNNEYGLKCDKCNYETRRKWISKEKDDIFKYPCIYSIDSKNNLSLRWSKINDKGHFGITKYIISNGNGYYKDIKGEYGCTEWSYYIKCSIDNIDSISNCFKNTRFINIVNAVKLTSNKYNYVILKHLKKDFWKEFV